MRPIDADDFFFNEYNRCGGMPIVGTCSMDNYSLVSRLNSQKDLLETSAYQDIIEWFYDTKKALWHKSKKGYRCSSCGVDNGEKSNYCPNCGYLMSNSHTTLEPEED